MDKLLKSTCLVCRKKSAGLLLDLNIFGALFKLNAMYFLPERVGVGVVAAESDEGMAAFSGVSAYLK